MKKISNYLIISPLLLFISLCSILVGQTEFNSILIDNTLVGAKSVFAADMDGDGDMDVLSSSDDWNTGRIVWYENDGETDPTLTVEDIQTFSSIGIVALFAADMDGDGDMDILSASEVPGTIGWSKNSGEVDPTWSSRSAIANVSSVESVFAADMDGDGDMDILTTSWYGSKLDWYENDGAAEPSWTKANIASGGGPKSVIAADMDGDGDMDIVAAFASNNSIAWYENDGATDPTWSSTVIATNAKWANSVYVADMDGDGDMDIVSSSEDDYTIAWYENDGGAEPTFDAIDVFSDDSTSPLSVSVADMDGDGDMDIVTSSYFELSWFANDGATDPTWSGSSILAEFGLTSIFLEDMDKDGDIDIVSSSSWSGDGIILWHEAILPPDEILYSSLSDTTIKEDEIFSVNFISKNDLGDDITFSAESDNNSVSVSIDTSTLTISPEANWSGQANIKVSANVGSTTLSVTFKLTVTPLSDIKSIPDVTIDEDASVDQGLTSTFDGTTTFTAVSDTNTVTVSISSSTMTLTPNANWHGVANIKAYASYGTLKDSTSFKLTVNPVNDLPTAFEWVSSASDTINITQTNLSNNYTLEWGASVDTAEGDSINYLLYATVGVYPTVEIFDTTSTSVSLSYQEILEGVFAGIPVNSATVKLTVYAHDGTDSTKVTGEDRLLYVNRYDYLSLENEGIPTEFALHENYPNPFNPSTTLRFDLAEASNITLTIFNMLGQKIRTYDIQSAPAGHHALKWNATNDYGDPVSAGIYLYQLHTKDFVKTRKMVLLK